MRSVSFISRLLIGVGMILISNGVVHGQTMKMDCALCHSCDNPTKEDPCLKMCPRSHPQVVESKDLGPDTVILDELENLYVPVRFDHKMHAKMSGISDGCVQCHHYQETDTRIQSCKECHPVDVVHEDLKQPGLKGAYHRQCLACHTEWDNDTACAVCHEKKAEGKLHGTATAVNIHRKYEPVPMNELITYETEVDIVPFHHKRHADVYTKDCSICHKQQSCTQCHTHNGNNASVMATELHPMGDIEEIDLHDTCFQCHEDDDCEKCHGQEPDYVFTHKETGWPLAPYHTALHCQDCHGYMVKLSKLQSECSACHKPEWEPDDFDHKITGVELDELHSEAACANCHVEGMGKPATCSECHDDGRVFDKSVGFRPK